MLQLITTESMQIRLDNLKLVTVFARKFPKQAEVEVFEMSNGEVYVGSITNYINLELLGENYVKNNNIEISTNIPDNEKIVRIVIGMHSITKNKIIEIIELSSGKIMCTSLSKRIIIDTVTSEQILHQIQ